MKIFHHFHSFGQNYYFKVRQKITTKWDSFDNLFQSGTEIIISKWGKAPNNSEYGHFSDSVLVVTFTEKEFHFWLVLSRSYENEDSFSKV